MDHPIDKARAQTVTDFGNQWKIHGHLGDDHWTSVDLLKDYVGPLMNLEDIRGKRVAEVGSGSGRIIRMLNTFGPAELHAIEPSYGAAVIARNSPDMNHLKIHPVHGDEFKIGNLDYIFSLGVIHHIPEPLSTLKNIRANLAPGGKFVVWVYGRENNLLYLMFYKLVCAITKKLPDFALDRISSFLNYLLVPYIGLCRIFPLPMKDYLLKVFAPCGLEKRKYIIFDQLNPEYAKYYRKQEFLDVLKAAGFEDIRIYHRHGYSWTAVCN